MRRIPHRVGIAIFITVALSGFAARAVASTWTCRSSLGTACAVTRFETPSKVTIVTNVPVRGSVTIDVFRDGAPYTSFVAPNPGPVEIDCVGCDGAAICIGADGCGGGSDHLVCVYTCAAPCEETVVEFDC